MKIEPGVTGGRAAIGARDAAWIEESCAAIALAAGDVGVAVEEEIDLRRRVPGRDVDEGDAVTFQFELKAERPVEATVAISPHHTDRRAKLSHPVEQRFVADIAEVPDFIRPGDRC